MASIGRLRAAPAAVLGALFMGAASTLGDFVWATWIPRHRAVYGLAHGAIVCFCLGLALGADARRPIAGGVAGIAIGLVAAGGFYLLAPAIGWSAMFLMWMLFWVLFAIVHARLRGLAISGGVVGRGLAAAVLSGAAFYAISGIWLRPSPEGPNYAWNLACWTFAFFPGFAALLATDSSATDSEAADS
jgi:hypothetical protein